MTKDEVKAMLVFVAAFENSEVDDVRVSAWFTIIGEVSKDDAIKRVVAFYRSGLTRRILPADVLPPPRPIDPVPDYADSPYQKYVAQRRREDAERGVIESGRDEG